LNRMSLEELPVSSASSSGDDGNGAPGAVDHDHVTRWSNDEYGGWLQLDVGSQRDVSAVGVAFHQGDERRAFADVFVSSDGVRFRHATFVQGEGDSTALQIIRFPALRGRYVRVVGYGNSANAWNSYNEVRVYKAL
jgi:endoglucanase